MKDTIFIVSAELMSESDLALAGEEYRNPLLTWVKIVFADSKPNANNQGIKVDEFPNLIKSMAYMPIKANYKAESGLEGHDEAQQIGVIKSGQQQADKVLAIGALYNDEQPQVVEYFKNEFSNGGRVDFSWEIRYKDSLLENGVEWLKQVTTKAVTAVKNPAYQGRTPLLSISTDDLIKAIDEELKSRGVMVQEV
jgi:hypothetical protein